MEKEKIEIEISGKLWGDGMPYRDVRSFMVLGTRADVSLILERIHDLINNDSSLEISMEKVEENKLIQEVVNKK